MFGFKKSTDRPDLKAELIRHKTNKDIIEEAFTQEEPNVIPYSFFENLDEGEVWKAAEGIEVTMVLKNDKEIKMKAFYKKGAFLNLHKHDALEVIYDPDQILVLCGRHERQDRHYVIRPFDVHSARAIHDGEIEVYFMKPKK